MRCNAHFYTLVHYRIGSLENKLQSQFQAVKVHYRIGSLENS